MANQTTRSVQVGGGLAHLDGVVEEAESRHPARVQGPRAG
jgi:hypothetical protein